MDASDTVTPSVQGAGYCQTRAHNVRRYLVLVVVLSSKNKTVVSFPVTEKDSTSTLSRGVTASLWGKIVLYSRSTACR